MFCFFYFETGLEGSLNTNKASGVFFSVTSYQTFCFFMNSLSSFPPVCVTDNFRRDTAIRHLAVNVIFNHKI